MEVVTVLAASWKADSVEWRLFLVPCWLRWQPHFMEIWTKLVLQTAPEDCHKHSATHSTTTALQGLSVQSNKAEACLLAARWAIGRQRHGQPLQPFDDSIVF